MNNNDQLLHPKTTKQTIKNSVISGSIFFLIFKLLNLITYLVKSILMFFIRPVVSLVCNKVTKYSNNTFNSQIIQTNNCTIDGKEYTDEEIYNFVNDALDKLPSTEKMKIMRSFSS